MIVNKFIESIERMENEEFPLLVSKAKAFNVGKLDPDFKRKLLEVFCSALTSDMKARFDMFLQENHTEFIKCFPMIENHMTRFCQFLSTLHIERYALESISQKLLDKWISVQ